MKRISLIAVIALFASVAGVAQDTKMDVRYKIGADSVTVVTFPNNFGTFPNNFGVRINADSLHRVFSFNNIPIIIFDSAAKNIIFDSVAKENLRNIHEFEPFINLSLIDRQLESLAQKKDVTAITVTKSFLDIMPEIHSYVEENGMEIKKIIAKLEQVDVYSSKNENTKKFMREISIISMRNGLHRNMEVLMRIKNETDDIVFYKEQDSKGNIKSLIMFSDNKKENEECVLIRLTGQFFTDDIKQIIKNKKKQ
ncbi:MAG: DUF4252 domain-containing protein [Prevotellaceae bacterium]|jgi:hypothetical protein|nr:DUF4252 domain-containing protein [Prevotellaceae bacterium]